ncbi:MAG TPA: hydrogenase small subunit [bacterium]|nr:hydrogenase small subunit [bacterium]
MARDAVDQRGAAVTAGEREFRAELRRRGVSRRQFMAFCGAMASALALPEAFAPRIARALEKAKKTPLVWLEFQDCAGNTESFLRASKPSVADIVLDTLSVDYHETIMAAAGKQAEEALARTVKESRGGYIAIVEGAIPTGDGGVYCTIGGKAAIDIAREVCGSALATIAIGTCAAFGGLPAAAPNPTTALGVADAVPGLKTLINLSACPANVENLTALIVHFLTFGSWPALDGHLRPVFAYGQLIHDACERRAHFDAGQYVEAWGDEAHRQGYCLYKMGCKGPVTYQNCPYVRWNEGTNWPIGCGHPCLGCAEPQFWDVMTPFYQHVPGVPREPVYAQTRNIDKVGIAAVAAVGAAFAGHGLVTIGRRKLVHDKSAPGGAAKTEPAKPADAKEKP